MIKIGIIGIGNVSWNVHLPVLLARNDLEISWVCDKNQDKRKVLEKKNIQFFENLEKATNFMKCDIVLITIPFLERTKIFEQIKNKCSGIFIKIVCFRP